MEHLSLQQPAEGGKSASSSSRRDTNTTTTTSVPPDAAGGRRSGKVNGGNGGGTAVSRTATSSATTKSQTSSLEASSKRQKESFGREKGLSTSNSGAVQSSENTPANGSGSVSSKDEQYQIWQQIQKDLEDKEVELAVQLSQKEKRPSATAVDPSGSRDSGSGNDGGFVYPDQHGKPPRNDSSSNDNQDDSEDEALKEILRISQEEAAAEEAARNKAPEDEEDEIALALQLSKKQAEEDRLRLERLQQTAGELSEEEQLRLAMEQSMQLTPQRNNGESNVDDSSHMDEDLKTALRLSQEAQQGEGEQYHHSLYEQPRCGRNVYHDDPTTTLPQPLPSSRPFGREFPYQEFSIQPMPDSDPYSVRSPDDGGDALPTSQVQRKPSEEQKDSSLKLSSRPRSVSRASSFDVDVDEETRIAMVREGQLDTRMAIMQGESQIVTCQGCMGKLHAPTQCSLVFCPTCNTVSPVDQSLGASL